MDKDICVTFYAVFDGHGGSQCAEFLKENLHLDLKSCLEDEVEGIKDCSNLYQTVGTCIKKAFKDCD